MRVLLIEDILDDGVPTQQAVEARSTGKTMGRNTSKHPVTRLTVDLTASEKELLSRLQEKLGARSSAETVRRAAQLCTDLLDAIGASGENQLFVGRDQGQLTRLVLTGLKRGP